MFSPGVVPPAHYGGTERVVDWLIKELTSQGHTIYFFGPHGSSVPRAEKVFFHDSAKMNINSNPVDIRDRIPGDTDIVHIHCASNIDYGYPVLKTVHGYPFHVKDQPFAQSDQFDDHYSFVSNAHRNMCGRPQNPYVYNGIKLEDYYYSEDKDDYFLFMGKLDWNAKGLEFALLIAKEMKLKLILAGDFMDPSSYERDIKGCLSDDIKYVGPVSGGVKAELLSRAKGLLSPIRWPEPFGLVVTEALASGTPVLTTNLGAMPEIMVQGVTGFICDTVGDFKQGVNLINKIYPKKCREHVENKFTSFHMASDYTTLYNTIINQYNDTSETRSAYCLNSEIRNIKIN
jgi:glycosyltransferase involved in cell wall biosynthesis